MITQFYI